jgi:enoyl-CoA hydratase
MVNKVVTRDELDAAGRAMAEKLAQYPRLGLWLSKQAINHVEDLRGKRTAMDAHYHMHHFAHAQNDLTTGNTLGGQDAKSMAAANKKQAGEA